MTEKRWNWAKPTRDLGRSIGYTRTAKVLVDVNSAWAATILPLFSFYITRILSEMRSFF